MRTTITIDDDIFQAVRSLASLERKTLGEAISELVRRGLAAQPPAISPRGLPVFSVSETAPPLTPEMVRQALDD